MKYLRQRIKKMNKVECIGAIIEKVIPPKTKKLPYEIKNIEAKFMATGDYRAFVSCEIWVGEKHLFFVTALVYPSASKKRVKIYIDRVESTIKGEESKYSPEYLKWWNNKNDFQALYFKDIKKVIQPDIDRMQAQI